MAGFIKKYTAAVVFAAFIMILAVADPLIPRRDYSEMENRNLAQEPEFTWTSFVEGRWTTKYEDYVNDQFIGRDNWITTKSVLESALFKIENNGVAYGDDGYMFEKYQSFNEERFGRNTAAAASFADRFSGDITFMLIPNSYEILADKMPLGLENIDQSKYITQAYSVVSGAKNITTVDLLGPLSAAKDDYIYYRTDHHWTASGAWIGYREFCAARGLPVMDLSSYAKHEVPDFYGTLYSKTKYWNAEPDTLTWYDIPIVSLTADGNAHDTLNDTEKFSRRDKYGALLWGNNGVTEITSSIAEGPAADRTLLVVKDSYSHSLAGFLTADYGRVILLDLRYYNGSVSELIKDKNVDDVLIMYNFMNFASDAEFAKLNS